MTFAVENSTTITREPSITPPSEVHASAHFTWYTVALCIYFVGVALLTRHIAHGVRPFNVVVRFIAVIIEWGLFFVAYRGIVVSGLRFPDVIGKHWSSRSGFWKDFKDSLLVIFIICVSTFLLVRLSPFTPSHTAPAKTGLQYLVTLLMAVTAGYTEEVIFRGFLLRQFQILTRNLGVAVLLQAILFSLAHGGNQSVTQYLKHGFSACVFAYLSISRKSLWPAILAHVVLDVLAVTLQFLSAMNGKM